MIFNPPPSKEVSRSGNTSITIPVVAFSGLKDGTSVSLVFTLFDSAALFPYDTEEKNVTVSTPILSATISNVNTSRLNKNATYTLSFQLERSVSLKSILNTNGIIQTLFLCRQTWYNASFTTVSIHL